jgi:FAD:protein FMN transferase
VIAWREFRAMGTDVLLLLDARSTTHVHRAFESGEQEFDRLEAMMSRFLPESELSRLNAQGELDASPDLLRVVELAIDARERTRGRFDPTVHDALVAAGYDRSFEVLQADRPAAAVTARCGGRIELREGQIALEPGFRLDLGGIGKGYAVERAAELVATAGPCLVDAGGDIAVRGVPESGTWAVAVETADGSMTLGLERGALATSGRDRRRWRRGGAEAHHIVDPRTGRPADTDLLRVTVSAADAVEAEIWAKALLLEGLREARREANALGLACVLVSEDGRTTRTGELA